MVIEIAISTYLLSKILVEMKDHQNWSRLRKKLSLREQYVPETLIFRLSQFRIER